MKNAFCWMQLNSTNLGQAKDFYTKLFAWHAKNADQMDHPYIEIDAGEGPGAGMMEMKHAPSHWLPFVSVNPLEEAIEKAVSLGAQVMVPASVIDQGGRYAVVTDPTGAAIGLYEPPAA